MPRPQGIRRGGARIKGAIQMTPIYKTAEGERLVRERYLAFLKYWPSPTSMSHRH